METTTEATASYPPPMRVLRTADRCDRCRAEAFTRATVSGVDLYFCGHHFAKYETRLREVTDAILDERAWINAKPSVPA